MAKGEDELLSEGALGRIERDIASTLRRRSPLEAKLAGALRVLAPYSPAVRNALAESGAVLARRGSFDRELWSAIVRDLAEAGDPRAVPLIETALAQEGAGGAATLSAASFVRDPRLSEPLGKLSTSAKTHLSFAAELARALRGESNGVRLAGLAPKLKESYRIAVSTDGFLPLTRSASELPSSIAKAVAVLRDSERHLGRWLIWAQISMRIGDEDALEEAREQAAGGPKSARDAWALAAWVLDSASPAPAVRPTMSLIARLSDRPSSERDLAFLFRMAEARLPKLEPMLNGLIEGGKLADETSIRAALYLARDYRRDELRRALVEQASSGREDIRGLAAASLWDLGEREAALRAAESLERSRLLVSLAWSALITAAFAGKIDSGMPIVTEPACRRLQRGWLDP